jgi:hypothetical protein
MELHQELDVKNYGTYLHDNELLNVVYTEETSHPRMEAYRLMTVLDPKYDINDLETSATELALYKRIDEIVSKKEDVYLREGDLYDTTTVFTSLALLWNIKQCSDLGWKVMSSCDGTDGVMCNNNQTILFGCMNINRYGEKQFRPFLMAVGVGEREEVFEVLLVAFQKYSRKLFGIIDITFLGGESSDHSHSFINGLLIAFPTSQPMQCYPVRLLVFSFALLLTLCSSAANFFSFIFLYCSLCVLVYVCIELIN